MSLKSVMRHSDDLSYRKLYEESLLTKKYIDLSFCKIFWPNLDIIEIIMLYYWDKSLNILYNPNLICHQSTKHSLEWNIEV
jgi:hypothetical protein